MKEIWTGISHAQPHVHEDGRVRVPGVQVEAEE